MDIKELTSPERLPAMIIDDLKNKTLPVPPWSRLVKEYDQKQHPVMDKRLYPDKTTKRGTEKMTRITLGLQKLAVKRMTGLIFGIPVQRVWKPQNDQEKKAAEIMESIFMKNRIDSLNRERSKFLYAGCEFVTIWYTQDQNTEYAGEKTELKLRARSFSPMNGDQLFPLFDEFDDLVALSVEYTRKENNVTVTYFDTYTATEHIRWRNDGGHIEEELREDISAELGKIPGIYVWKPEPVWEDESENVFEAEWTYSRQGNYIRKNARPNWVVFSNGNVQFGKEAAPDNSGRNVLRYGKDDKAGYVTWEQAIDSIKFHVDQICQNFFKQLQLPDMSMENMKLTPMSGEARKMVFIDAEMKVTDESGIWLEGFDREINVVRAHAANMYPQYKDAINSVQVEVEISPYKIKDEGEKINNLTNATGGKAIMSQKTAIQYLGYAEDVEKELEQIRTESEVHLFDEPTI